MKLTARHLFRGRGLHRPRRVQETVPLGVLLRPCEAMVNDFAWCPAEKRVTLHAFFRLGGRECWTCRTRTMHDPLNPVPASDGAA